MWIWLAMSDLKAHLLHGKSFTVLRGPILIPIGLAIVAITVAVFFLNAVFAFAITQPGTPRSGRPSPTHGGTCRRSWCRAPSRIPSALSTTVVTRWGQPWFTLSLGIVTGVMMVSYVAVPARIIGVKPTQSRRDKLSTSVVGGLLGTIVCTPPYVLGRVGILMIGTDALLIPGIVVIALGVTLQAGATSAVRAIKMSVSLTATPHQRSPLPAEPATTADP